MNPILKLMQCQNPLKEFVSWLDEAKKTAAIREPSAMIVATCAASGQPSTRAVLLKQWDDHSLTFFTNYSSRKGRELAENPKAAATFYWDPLAKQVQFRGRVEKTSREVSEKYWRSRERASQLSQWISKQSENIPNDIDLTKLVHEAEQKWHGKDIPCPENWGGYKLIPDEVEFWVGQPHRLHDRIQFRLNNSSWICRRLYP